MPRGRRAASEITLVNGSRGDPVLFIDYPGKDDAILFDCGNLASLSPKQLADLEAVFLTHHHLDHFTDFDRIIRANLDGEKTLHVFGPVHTIERVYRRIKCYEIQHFPMQQVVWHVHEIDGEIHREAVLECGKKFPEPIVEERHLKGSVVYQNADLKVEAAPTDHTVPGLAYALVEKTGYHPDGAKLSKGALRPGNWVGKVLKMLRDGSDPATALEIDGGHYTLDTLEQYFVKSRGARVTFITDTAFSDASRPGLLKLAHKAQRLYCDCYYARAQGKQAAKHRHMTSDDAAALAKEAEVEQLILIHFAARYSGRFEMLVDEARKTFPNTSAVWNHDRG